MTMTDVPMKAMAIRTRHAGGDVVRERLAEPTPGQYWRARHDIAERTDHRGQYRAIAAGAVHMLKAIEVADGQAHVITLAAHPEASDQKPLLFHADDFEKLWDRELDGEAIRERELAALATQMRLTQQAMSQPPPEATPAGLLGQQPALNDGGATGQELATVEGLRGVIAHTDAVRERTASHLSWIQTHSEALGEQASAMARYHQEKATAMMASASSQLALLDSLMNRVKNLRFYAGEGVVVTQLLDGQPAPPAARIVIYQDLLAFDEELLLYVDDGGIDHTMVDAVASALQDTRLLTQMIPSERGLVLVRFRSAHKEFLAIEEGDKASIALAKQEYNSRMSEESKRHRLLYRDGERVYLVECDDVLPAIKQLLPNSKEQASYFQREFWDHRSRKTDYVEITNEELGYAKAQRRQREALTDYARVLIILWGLRDRTDLFAPTTIAPFSNWLDEGFQLSHLALVSHDGLIGEQRPRWQAFQSEANRHLCEGATVLVNVSDLADKETAIGMFVWRERAGDYEQKWKPTQRWQTGVVKLQDGVPVVMAEVSRYDDRTKTKRTAVRLTYPETYLVLDRLLSEDLHYYLTSRSSRREYAGYVSMFQQAHAWVVSVEQSERPWFDWLRAALREGSIVAEERDIRRGILQALASLRPANGYPPDPTGARPALRRALLNATFDALTDPSPRIDAVERYAAGVGCEPVGLFRASEADLVFYRTATAEERDPRLSGSAFRWVVRETVSVHDGQVTVVAGLPVLYRRYPGELLLKEWEAPAKTWFAMHEPHGLNLERVVALMDSVREASKALDRTDTLAALMEQAYLEYSAKHSRKSVARTSAMFPIGTCLYRKRPVILMACIDELHAAVAWGDEGTKERARHWIKATYANPTRQLEAVEDAHAPYPCSVNLDVVAKGSLSAGYLEGFGQGIGNADELRTASKRPSKARDDWEPGLRITSLTEQGARLFPWLVEFCEAPC